MRSEHIPSGERLMQQSKNRRWLVSLVLATGLVLVSRTAVWAAPRLAFLSSRQGAVQIFVLDEEGKTKKVHLTSDESVYRSPQLSPDGRWIAFHSKHDSKPGLFVVRSNGGEPRLLTKEVTRFLGWQYAWSPDSRESRFSLIQEKRGPIFTSLI